MTESAIKRNYKRRSGSTPRVLANLGLGVLGTVTLAAYSSFARPIWIDEFLHYALGAIPSDEILSVLYESTGPNVNHGQTGLYMYFDYWLLQMFGASLFWLRFPSLVAAAIMLASAVYFLRVKGFGYFWQYLVLLAFGAQSMLMHFAGEARPYIWLASTAIATLAYYQTPLSRRNRLPVMLVGAYGVLFGAIAHPYYIVFFVLIAAFSLWTDFYVERNRLDLRGYLTFLNPYLVIPGALLFLVIGSLTWLRGNPVFERSAWDLLGPIGALREGINGHFGMFVWTREIPPNYIVLFFVGLLVVLLLFRLASWSREATASFVLIGLGIGTTVGISVISAISSYWILSRQWVGGMAITTIGVVWFLAVVYRRADVNGVKSIKLIAVGLSAYISLVGIFQIWGSMTQIASWISTQNEILTADGIALDIEIAESKINSVDSDIDWVDAANLNIIQGNEVWPGFAEYYAGYRRLKDVIPRY